MSVDIIKRRWKIVKEVERALDFVFLPKKVNRNWWELLGNLVVKGLVAKKVRFFLRQSSAEIDSCNGSFFLK